MALGYKKFFKVFLLVLVAIVTGFSVGKIYVSTIVPEQISSFTEDDLREKESVVLDLVGKSQSSNPTAFNALELYLIAEYNLNHSETFYKLMTGMVNTIIRQPMKSEKIKVGDMYVYNKMSPSSVAQICSQTVFDASTKKIKINSKGVFTNTSENNLQAKYDEKDFVDYSIADYEQIFNTKHPEVVMPYIISSVTCGDDNFSSVTKNADGNYAFEITLDGSKLVLAATCYSAEIKFSSSLSDKPIWQSMSMEVVVDENFNFVSIHYLETYKMKYGPLTPTVTDDFYETFLFGEDVPPISQVLGREVA